MTDQENAPQTKQVQVSPIKQLRLIRSNERPNDALLEITTGNGAQHFLLPKASLSDLAQKLADFAKGGGQDTGSAA